MFEFISDAVHTFIMKLAEHMHRIGIKIYNLGITSIGIVLKVLIPSIGIGIEIDFHLAEVLVSVSKYFFTKPRYRYWYRKYFWPSTGIGIGIEIKIVVSGQHCSGAIESCRIRITESATSASNLFASCRCLAPK